MVRLLSFAAWLVVTCLCILPSSSHAQPAAADAGTPVSDSGGVAQEAAEADGATPEPAANREPADEADYEWEDTGPRVPTTLCDAKRIERIAVVGNRRVAEEDILAALTVRVGSVCTDLNIQEDAQALWDRELFDDIVVEAEESEENSRSVVLTFRVSERPAIAAVTYEGNDELDDSDLDEAVDLAEGDVLSLPKVREQVTKIRDAYAEKGYFLAQVRYELVPRDDNEAEVRFIIEEGQEVTVRRINFLGNQNLSNDELRSFMQTSQSGFWSFISSNDSFQATAFDDDVNRLQALYYDRGYLNVQVGTPRIELTADRAHIDITIPITEGPRYRIGRLRIAEYDAEGNEVEPLGGRRKLRSQIEANPGDWFSSTQIRTSLVEITRYYRDEGYAHVDIAPETATHDERRIVDITIAIRRGSLTRIERINIRGNDKTSDEVIRRELLVVEGELYNQTNLEKSKNRVQALGYFERVDFSEEDGSTPNSIIVNIEVAERSTGTFQVGAGFSSLESFILNAQIQEQNFLGRGQALSLQLQLSGVRQMIQLRFVEPYLFGSDWTGSVDVFRTSRQFPEFVRDSTGASFSIGHPLFDDDLRLFLQYRGDYVDISARTGGLFGFSGNPQGGLERLALHNLYRDGLSSSLRVALTYDSRDNRLFPTRGIYASASSELADRYLGSDNIFLRHQAFLRFYYPIFGDFILRGNMEWGLITSRDTDGVPVFERFYLGGIYNLRGFPLNSVGPRAGVTRGIDPLGRVAEQGRPIGGNMQLLYNLELEFPIVESVGLRWVFFTDGGNAWNLEGRYCQAPDTATQDPATDACDIDLTRLRTSWGFGLRWISPLGPLRFEWGLPFSPRSYEEDRLFEFTIGNFF